MDFLGGQRSSNVKFENRNFSIFISDLDSLRKSMIVNWFSFIFILSASSSKIAKTANFRLDVLFFVNFDVFLDFNSVNIKIKKNEDYFTFMLFCKESGSAIRI